MSKFENYLKRFDIAANVTDEELEKTQALLQLYGPTLRRSSRRLEEFEEECYESRRQSVSDFINLAVDYDRDTDRKRIAERLIEMGHSMQLLSIFTYEQFKRVAFPDIEFAPDLLRDHDPSEVINSTDYTSCFHKSFLQSSCSIALPDRAPAVLIHSCLQLICFCINGDSQNSVLGKAECTGGNQRKGDRRQA